MMLELRHLRILCAIADAGSLGKAALALRLSQPAMSAQVRRLEQMLGGELFVRSRAGVEPTEFGLGVVDQARDILTRVEALGWRPASPPGVEVVTLRLGATITPVLPGLVARTSDAHPEITISVRSEYAIETLMELLEADRIDMALVLDYPGRELRTSEVIASRPFTVEPTFVAMPANHRLAQRVEVPLSELSDEAWFVTPDDGAGWPGVFYEACAQAGFTPKRTHQLLDEKNLLRLIVAGVGVTACQPTMKPIYGMTILPLEGSPIRCRQLLAWRRDGTVAPLAQELHRFAAEAHQELIRQTPHYRAWAARHQRG